MNNEYLEFLKTKIKNVTESGFEINESELNSNLAYLGTFSTDGTDVILHLHQDIADSICAGELTMTVTGTPTTTTTTTSTSTTTTTTATP